MNVLFITKDALTAGGVGEVLRQLCLRLPAHGVRPVLYNPHPNVEEFARGLGVVCHRGPLSSGWSKPLKHWRAAKCVRQVAAEEKIDLAHALAVSSPTRTGLVLQDRLGIPLVVTSHGEITPVYRAMMKWSRNRTRRIGGWLSRAARVTHLNEGMRDFAMELASLPDGGEIIPNGTDLGWWRGGPGGGFPTPSVPYILAIGRLTGIKGLDRLIDVHAKLVAGGNTVSLVFAGGGEAREALSAHAKSRGFRVFDELAEFCKEPAPSICFCGHVTGEWKKWVLGNALFVAHPNSTTEAFPLVFLDAMASGKALVCFDLPTYRGIVADGVNALIAPVGDYGRFEAAALELLRDERLRSRFEARNLEEVRKYDWEKVVEQYVAMYRRVRDGFR